VVWCGVVGWGVGGALQMACPCRADEIKRLRRKSSKIQDYHAQYTEAHSKHKPLTSASMLKDVCAFIDSSLQTLSLTCP
jgi:hypothetical protein